MTHIQEQALKRCGVKLSMADVCRIERFVKTNKKKTFVRITHKERDPVHRVTWAGRLMYVIFDKKDYMAKTAINPRMEFGGQLGRKL